MKKGIYFITVVTLFAGCIMDKGPYCEGKIHNNSFKDLYIILSEESCLQQKDYANKSFVIKKIINKDTIWNENAFIKNGDSDLICVPPYGSDYEKSMKERYIHDTLYIFLINREVICHQPWDSIVEKKLYENVLSYSIDSLKKLNWEVDYRGKYAIANPN